MPKTKLEKHLEELGETTSGGAHDAVTFSGKGLGFLRDLFKSNKKKQEEEENDFEDGDMDEDDKSARKTKKNAANVGDTEEADEDPEDPADEDDDSIISNKGKRTGKDQLKSAVSKNARPFDERRFEKSLGEHEKVLDASPALKELTKSILSLGKSYNGTQEIIEELASQNLAMAKSMMELHKSNAALAADIELIKKQPVGAPATGFVVLNKNEGGTGRRLSKSDIQDSLTDLVNEGAADSRALARLSHIRSDVQLREFVDTLPAAVRERL